MATFKPFTNPFSTFFLCFDTILYIYIWKEYKFLKRQEKHCVLLKVISISLEPQILDHDKRWMSILDVKVKLIKCMGVLVFNCPLEIRCKLCIDTPNFTLVTNLPDTTESNTMWGFTPTWWFFEPVVIYLDKTMAISNHMEAHLCTWVVEICMLAIHSLQDSQQCTI